MIIRSESMRLLLISLLATESLAARGKTIEQEPMSNLSVHDIAQLARMGMPELKVSFDSEAMRHALQTMKRVQSTDEQLVYFLAHGATNGMLAELFHMSANAVKARRKLLESGKHTPEGRRRRPPMPNETTREAVHHYWYALRKGHESQAPKIHDYRSLHEKFPALSMGTLYAVVNEFED